MGLSYLAYNREERDLCAHLFRLLLEDQPNWQPLKDFLDRDFIGSPQLFCEAAVIRDAYYARKPEKADDGEPGTINFLDGICDLIATMLEAAPDEYTRFSELQPETLRNPRLTHPKQIAYKLKESGAIQKPRDADVYGSLQAMFNAKPDLVICADNTLYIYEAKYTMPFDEAQLERTRLIGKVWAKLLYKDLGFEVEPDLVVRKLGLSKPDTKGYDPDISWKEVCEIANRYWLEDDYSMKVLQTAAQLCQN